MSAQTIDIWFDSWSDMSAVYLALDETIKEHGSVSVYKILKLSNAKSGNCCLKSLGWTSTAGIRYTGDGLGHYILKLPLPTVLKRNNKEDI